MRLIAAGLFVFGGLLLIGVVLSSAGVLEHARGWLLAAPTIVVMFALLAAALWLFNPRGSNPLGRLTPEEHIRELERLGLLDDRGYQATRAFGVEEYEDEGLHYFLELTDGGVLFLSGQYLYDYEPITDDPELNRPRKFPSTQFTVRRHRKEGYVADLVCGGSVLEPEVVAPPFGKDVWRAGAVPGDGEVITTKTYDELKTERLTPSRR